MYVHYFYSEGSLYKIVADGSSQSIVEIKPKPSSGRFAGILRRFNGLMPGDMPRIDKELNER